MITQHQKGSCAARIWLCKLYEGYHNRVAFLDKGWHGNHATIFQSGYLSVKLLHLIHARNHQRVNAFAHRDKCPRANTEIRRP